MLLKNIKQIIKLINKKTVIIKKESKLLIVKTPKPIFGTPILYEQVGIDNSYTFLTCLPISSDCKSSTYLLVRV